MRYCIFGVKHKYFIFIPIYSLKSHIRVRIYLQIWRKKKREYSHTLLMLIIGPIFSFYFYLKCMASKDNLCCTDDLDFGRPNMGAPCQSFDVHFKQDKVMRAWNRVPLNKFLFFLFVCYVVSFGPGYPFSFIIMLWMDYNATYTLLRIFFF